MKISGVILDFFGVVVEYAKVSHTIAKALNIPYEQYSPIRKKTSAGEITYQKFIREISKRSGKSEEHVDTLIKQTQLRLCPPKPDISALAQLKPRKVILANAIKETTQLIIEKYNISELVDKIIISSDIKVRKPAVLAYELALKALGTKPSETIYVGDEQEHLDGAKALGMLTAFMPGEDRQAKSADFSFTTLTELVTELNKHA